MTPCTTTSQTQAKEIQFLDTTIQYLSTWISGQRQAPLSNNRMDQQILWQQLVSAGRIYGYLPQAITTL